MVIQPPQMFPSSHPEGPLADFSTEWRVVRIALLSLVVGACSAGIALALLDLIGLFTHLLYYGNVGVSLVPPTLSHLHAIAALIPVGGGAIIGAMRTSGPSASEAMASPKRWRRSSSVAARSNRVLRS
jgi:hypothetical protein